MISEHKGDLLKSDCDIICHQVNLQGVMGGGLAKQIATKYPNCEIEYAKLCWFLTKETLRGQLNVFAYKEKSSMRYIANCFTQNEDYTTNYEWLKECVKRVKSFANHLRLKSVGIPKNYGCRIASGDWNIVKKIWCDSFEDEQNIELQIWEL